MTEHIIIALISGTFTLIIAVLGIIKYNSKSNLLEEESIDTINPDGSRSSRKKKIYKY